MKIWNKNRGITLIALVVTIVVLLILAGISVSMLTGQNGILNKAAEAKEMTEISSKDEQRKLAQAEALMNTEKTTYKGVTLPEGFAPTKIDGEDSIDDGLVITDGNGNEYVWVEVPRTDTVYPNAGINITEFTDEEYTKIESDLNEYTKDYKKNTDYRDVYYEDSTNGWYKNEAEYNMAKKKMLKSIYQNEGFWVGRYEAGIETNRITSGAATTTPLSKANLYPYTYVTRTQAKVLAEKVESGNYTSSLMFGVQWRLILSFMHNRGDIDNNLLINNSTLIGNYNDNLWNIVNSEAKYSTDLGKKFNYCPYQKKENAYVLLTTGATKSFSNMNIYDMAGNVWEWTLEYTSNNGIPCAIMGGNYGDNGSSAPMSGCNGGNFDFGDVYVGFRISLY